MLVLASPLLFFAWIGSGNEAPARSTSPQALAETCVVEPRPVQGEYLATDFSPRDRGVTIRRSWRQPRRLF